MRRMASGVDSANAETGRGGTLLERSEQLAALNELLAAVASTSQGRLVLIGGEAGVGKTALVRCFSDRRSSAARVASGACDPLFTPRPLAPFQDLALEVGGEFAAAVDRARPPHDVAAALLRALRLPSPTIVVLEDLHWADEASLDVLRLVGRRARSVPALLLFTYRDDQLGRAHPLRTLLGELGGAAAAVRLHLAPLSLGAVVELARPHAVDATELHRRTGGNPFFVTEVLAAGAGQIPATVSDAVLARAARLSPRGRTLLEAVAVVPPVAEVWLLHALCPDSVGCLEECLQSGTLTAVAGGVAFRHELARMSIEATLPPDQRLDLNSRALVALSNRGGVDPSRVAHHAEVAGEAESVLRYAPAAAARAASTGAHRESAAQYARALRFADRLPAVERGLLHELHSHETFLYGELDEAIASRKRALDLFFEADATDSQGPALSLAMNSTDLSGPLT